MREQNQKAYKFKQKRTLMESNIRQEYEQSENVSATTSPSKQSGFPRTTNEDFHNQEVFKHLYNKKELIDKINKGIV